MLIKGAARLVFLSRHKVLGKDKVILKMASGVWQARMGGARTAGYLAGTAAHIFSIFYTVYIYDNRDTLIQRLYSKRILVYGTLCRS